MAGQVTGLSADTLEYILLGLSLAYTLIAFFEWRAGRNTPLGRVLGKVLLVLPMIEGVFRKMRRPKKAPPVDLGGN